MKRFFLFLCIFLQACFSHFSEEVDKNVSDAYFYVRGSGEIVYLHEGNSSELDYEILDADKATFRPIARDFGKDKNYVFYKAKKLPQVDYAAFMIEGNVIKDIEQVSPDRFDMEIAESTGSRPFRYARTGKAYSKNQAKD